MTTGSKTFNFRYVARTPTGGAGSVGRLLTKSWTGGDAIKPATPRTSYPRIVRSAKEWEAIRKANSDAARERARRKRLLPPQPYHLQVYDDTISYHRFYDKTAGTKVFTYGVGPADTFPASFPAVPVDQEYILLGKLRQKAYGSGFNPAVFTAEGREACGMIANGATRVRMAIGSLLRKDWRGLSRHLSIDPQHAESTVKSRKNLSGQWLEVMYGWSPLVSDMEDGGAYLGYNLNLKDYGGTKLVVRRRFQCPTEYREPGPNDFIWSRRDTYYTIQYIIYNVRKSSTLMPSIATVASVAWEKLPYSFVADWVIPIGDYIEAMRTASDLKGKIVKSVRRTTIWSLPRPGTNLYSELWSAHGGPRKSNAEFTRTVSEELSPPLPYAGFDLTPTSVLSSWRRAGNAVALLAQRKWFAPASR